MRSDRWFVRPEWIYRNQAEMRDELAASQAALRYHLGRLLLSIFKPWTLPGRLIGFIKAFRFRGEIYDFSRRFDPGLPDCAPFEVSKVANVELAAQHKEVHRLFDANINLYDEFSYRLGTLLFSLLSEPMLIFRFSDMRELITVKPVEMPGQFTATRSAPHRMEKPRLSQLTGLNQASHTENQLFTDWGCAGPVWFEHMLAIEGVDQGVEGAKVLLCGIDAEDKGSPSLSRIQASADKAKIAGAQIVFWLFGGIPNSDFNGLIEEGNRIFVDSPRYLDEAKAVYSGSSVNHLAPAVQPLLHNPIDWWEGVSARKPVWENTVNIPDAWAGLIQVARGVLLTDEALQCVEGALQGSLPTREAPVWAKAMKQEYDWTRYVRTREVLQHHTLGNRIRLIGASMDLCEAEEPPELASVLIPTFRSKYVDDILETFTKQTYIHRELVLVLHGDDFDMDEIRKKTETIKEPVYLLNAPADWTVGRCLDWGVEHTSGAWILKMDDDDWYGRRYVESQVIAASSSQAGALSKKTHPCALLGTDTWLELYSHWEWRYCSVSGGPTQIIRRNVLEHIPYRWVPRAVSDYLYMDCTTSSVPIMSTDRFNMVRIRRAPKEHNWTIEDDFFYRFGRLLPEGQVRFEDFEV
jgi:hypothetical protein